MIFILCHYVKNIESHSESIAKTNDSRESLKKRWTCEPFKLYITVLILIKMLIYSFIFKILN